MSAPDSDSVARTRRGYAAFAAGDLDTIADMFSPQVLWHVPGRSSLAGDYRGIDAVFGYFGQLLERSGGTFKAELLECGEIAPGTVAALTRITGDMTAAPVDTRMVSIYREDADGKVVEVLNFAEDQYAMDEAEGPIAIALPDARRAEQAAPVTT